jgi:thiamine kinase-like enzyme
MADLPGILIALEPHLGPLHGDAVPLSGGITNRNYRASFGDHDCVVRVPGNDTELLGIDREAERMAAREAARLGIAPELLYADEECSVTAFVDAQPSDAESLRADPGPVAQALRAFHDSSLQLPSRFWVPELLSTYAELVKARGVRLPADYGRAQDLVARIAAVLPLSDPVPCHDDLLAGNVLQGAAGVLLVDWEYAGTGHRLFDLGNLAVNNDFDDEAEERLLEAYLGAGAPPGTRAGLKLMRIVSDAREAAWGVVQGLISELDFDFDEYAGQHFERLHEAAADPRLKGWMDAAAT